MKKKIQIISIIGFALALALIPAVVIEARERGDRTHPTDRPPRVEEPAPTPSPPSSEPEPIIVPQELLERWQEMIEQGLLEEVEEEYRVFIEDGIYPTDGEDPAPQDPPDEEPPEQCTEQEGDEEVSDRIRNRVIHRSRGTDPDPVATHCDEEEQEEEPAPEEEEEEDNDSTYLEQIANEIHRLTNIEREKAGLPLLENDPLLEDIAETHSEHMAENNFFSHTTIDGCDLTCRFDEAEYVASAWGENIAWRSSSVLPNAEDLARMFVVSWMNSGGHRDNMLSSTFTNEGVGLAMVGNKVFATVDFARP